MRSGTARYAQIDLNDESFHLFMVLWRYGIYLHIVYTTPYLPGSWGEEGSGWAIFQKVYLDGT